MSAKLQREVWALDRCSGCGACVAACAKGMLHWGDEHHPRLEERQKKLGLSRLTLRACQVCDRFCELCCPRLADPAPREAVSTVSARGVGVVRPGDPNSVVQALLVAARASGLIDGAIVLDMDPWTLVPVARVATTVEEIVSSVGMQYLWAPVLSGLNEAIFQRRLSRVAVTGPPCVAEGARRLMEAEHEGLRPYRQAIRLTVACFCTGMYVPGLVTQLLGRGLGISPDRIRGLTARPAEGALRVALWDGTQRDLALTEIQPFTRRGCASCHDYLGESADVAVGTVGALRGHATLITRTTTGEALLRNALGHNLLQIAAQVDTAALSEASVAKDRRVRAEALAECRILMLEALADPMKRAEAKSRLVSLYGASQAGASRKEETNGGCSGCSGGGC